MSTKKLSRMAGIFLAVFLCVSGITTLKAQPSGFPGVDPNAVMISDFEGGNFNHASQGAWSWRPFGRGERVTLELASRAEGDPVRFGNYAMKINIDFTAVDAGQTVPANISPGPDNPRTYLQIPGNNVGGAKRLGMWVYTTPGVHNMWFRIATRPINGAGTNPTDGAAPGYGWSGGRINWTGWRYVIFDLPHGHEFHPDGIRFLVTSGQVNYHANGFIIIDNIRITDRSFQEDLTPPVITTLEGNGMALNDATIHTSTINLLATFHDNHANSSGLNYQEVRVIVNGHPFTEGDADFTLNQVTNTVELTNLTLSNGTHNVTIHVEDNFGHITTQTATFTIDADDGADAPAELAVDADAHVGNVFEMKINTENSGNIKAMNVVIRINEVGTVSSTNGVVFAPSAAGSTFNFNAASGELTINLVNDYTAPAVETLATINVDIARNSFPTDILRISPVSSNVTYDDNSFSLFSLFNPFTRNTVATYNFVVNRRVVGVPGEVLVTDLSGNPVAGATVYALNTNMTSILAQATTNADGIASGMGFTDTNQGINVYVERSGSFSHTEFSRTLNPLLTSAPTNIMPGVNLDPTTMKTITWQSSIVGHSNSAIMRLAKKSDGESSFEEVIGRTKVLEYVNQSSGGTVMGSSVTLEGLEPGTTYIYQVGDGTNWSPTREFTTTTAINRFSFAAFGDLQATNVTPHMNRWLAAAATIEEKIVETGVKPFFTLNVADIVDTDDRWIYFEAYAHLYNERPIYANINRVFAFGNHEYMGNPDADNIKFMSGVPRIPESPYYNARLVGTGSYAAIFGNMVVVALDWELRPGATATQHMQAKAEWMDYIFTKYAHKTWKIVTLHYPIFPDASTAGSQAIYGPIFDKHNVNIVFCGHGHRHRRVQVRNGAVTSPAGNFTTFQPTIDGGTLHFEIGDIRRDNLHVNNSWIYAEVDGARMTFTVRDANNNILPAQGFVLYAGANHKVEFSVVNDEKGTLIATEAGVEIFTGQQILAERDIVFRATPVSGYRVKEWAVDGNVVANNTSRDFTLSNLEADAVVTVEFEVDPRTRYEITFSVVAGEGTLTATVDGDRIDSGEEVVEGETVVFTAAPANGYQIKAWMVDGDIVANHTENTYTLTVTAEVTVTIEFERVTTYHTVTFSVIGVGGTLTATVGGTEITSGNEVPEGSDVIFVAAPNSGYVVKEWTLNDTAVADNTTETYTLSNLTENATVTVEFEQSTGINDIFSAIQVFPNPFTSMLNITGAENSFLQVLDVLGTIVYTRQITVAEESIHLGNLPAGVYFFRLEKDGQAKTMKVVKQ